MVVDEISWLGRFIMLNQSETEFLHLSSSIHFVDDWVWTGL